MSQTFAKLHLIGITLITILFLWTTLPGTAHAQRRDVCELLLVPPRQAPLPVDRRTPLEQNKSRLV